MTIHGCCLCGDVQYEILGELNDAAYCHCSMCRRALGAAFGTYARVDADEFQWLSGEDLIATYESSPSVYRSFCRQCGSPLGAMGEGRKAAAAINEVLNEEIEKEKTEVAAEVN